MPKNLSHNASSLSAPTELGAFLGIISGLAAVVVNGQIIGFDQAVSSITGEVIASGPFSYFWLTNSSECAVCGTTTMITFIVVPLVAGFCTLLFSKLDIMIRGDRARKPIFQGTQPEDCKNYNLTELNKQETMDKRVDEKEEEDVEEFDADEGTEEEGVDGSNDLKVDGHIADETQSAQVAAG